MKILYKILSIPVLFLALWSCSDLDQMPQSTTTNLAVFGSENGLSLYTNSFYSMLPSARGIHSGDEMADYAARTQVTDYLRENAYSPRQSSGWSWSDLRNINYFLENNNSEKVLEDTRYHYTALAKFFRAYFYFEKVKRFGDVPWINKTMDVSDPNLFAGRDPRALVMDSVMNDLNYAILHIKDVNDGSRTTITRDVVLAYKSRIALFEGTMRKYHAKLGLQSSSDAWLEASVSASEELISGGKFSLNTSGDLPYRDLFISSAPVASEVLLTVAADPELAVYHDANWWWTSSTYGARISLTKTFVNTYLQQNGQPFTDKLGYETMVFSEEVKDRDLRLGQTIRMQDYTRTNAGAVVPAPPIFSYTYTGYQPIKWTVDDMFYDGGNRNFNSISVIRYAEILLNHAEAKKELGDFDADNWTTTIGALRTRAGIANTMQLPTRIDPYLQSNYFPEISDAIMLEIRRERGIELVLEGLRFYDLVRWKKGELMEMTWDGFYVPALDTPLDLNEDGMLDVAFYTTTPTNPVAGVTYINVSENIPSGVNPQKLTQGGKGRLTWLQHIPKVWQDKKYLYPIPENDLLLNPELGQNPGW